MSANARVAELYAEHRRLTILRLLAEGGGRGNSSVLETGCRHFGVDADRAAINAAIRFLAAAGCLSAEELRGDLLACTITPKGRRVAAGLEFVEGVETPSPN